MKKYFHFTKRIFFTFLCFGILVFIADLFIQSYWLKFLGFVLNNPDLGYDFQPTILKYIQSFLAYSPWVVFGIIFVTDIFKRNFAKSISFFLGLALVYASFIGYFLLGPSVSDYANRTEFDPISWRDKDLINNWENPVRLRMVDNLLKTYKLVGMSKNQIDELLGVPQPPGYFSDHDYVYWLGPERGLISIDSEWLGIKFQDNVAIEARILRD
jgi:hypothetical protein